MSWRISSQKARYELAEQFISRLRKKPLRWYVGGSTAKGTHRPSSDIDVFVLFDKDEDVPFFTEEELGPIDFHYFAKDWEVYKLNPQLLEDW